MALEVGDRVRTIRTVAGPMLDATIVAIDGLEPYPVLVHCDGDPSHQTRRRAMHECFPASADGVVADAPPTPR